MHSWNQYYFFALKWKLLIFGKHYCVVQYRSEISGLRTRKTHAQFLRKRVLKNACSNTRLRAFACIWCACFLLLFTLIYGILLLLLSTKGKTKGSANKHQWIEMKISPPTNKQPIRFRPCAWCWCTVASHWQTSDCYSNIFVMDWM